MDWEEPIDEALNTLCPFKDTMICGCEEVLTNNACHICYNGKKHTGRIKQHVEDIIVVTLERPE